MRFDVAVVRDNGDSWIVDYVTTCDYMFSDIGEKYVRISAMSSEKIKEAKSNGYPVTIPKGIEGEVTPGQVIVTTCDELQNAKNKAEYEVNSIFNSMLYALSFRDMCVMTLLFVNFLDRGIYITDENVDEVKKIFSVHADKIKDRDDVYVEYITNKSKEDLDDLQEYIDAREKVKRMYDLYKEVRSVLKRIKAATTVDEVNTAKDAFLHKFNFPGS